MFTAMGDWIDEVFDELDGRVVNEATRFRLEDLLETAYIEDGEERAFINRIHAEDLTNEGVTQLFRELLERQPRTPDKYAPSQTELARWIWSFCFY